MHTRRSTCSLSYHFWLILVPLVYSQDLNCTSLTEEVSSCINIRQCSPFLNLMMNHENSSGEYLRSMVCGCDGEDPLICCPINASQYLISSAPIPIQSSSTHEPLSAPYCGINIDNDLVSNLVDAKEIMQMKRPWMVLLGYKSSLVLLEWRCAGSLISWRHVLTAAHCVHERNDLILVRLGGYHENPVDLGIERAITHPEFSRVTYSSDIAVLKLEREIKKDFTIRPICLPFPDYIRHQNLTNKQVYIAGWGATINHGIGTKELRELGMPILENQHCQRAYNRTKGLIDHRVICAGYIEGGKGTCDGDSGGPVIAGWPTKSTSDDILLAPHAKAYYVLGIVSYSYRCAQAGYPEVFTRVSEYLDFIMQQLN